MGKGSEHLLHFPTGKKREDKTVAEEMFCRHPLTFSPAFFVANAKDCQSALSVRLTVGGSDLIALLSSAVAKLQRVEVITSADGSGFLLLSHCEASSSLKALSSFD